MTLKSVARTDFPSFEFDTTVSKMLGALHSKSLPTGVVFKNNRYLGLIDRRALFGTRLDPTNTKVYKCVRKTPKLSSTQDITSALEIMSKVGLNYLPLQTEESIIGVVRAIDLVMKKLHEQSTDVTIHDISFDRPQILGPTDRIGKALKIMQQDRVDQVPVFNNRELVGVVSDTSILQYLLMPQKSSSSTRSKKEVGKTRGATVDTQRLSSMVITPFLTTSTIPTITRDTTLKNALLLMLRHSLNDLVVMEENRVFGMLTLRNIVSHITALEVQDDITINFVGVSKTQLDSSELDHLKRIAYHEAEKLQRRIGQDEITVSIRIKEMSKSGNKHQYSVATRVEAGGRPIASTKEDWKVETALRKSFKSLGAYKKRQ